MSDPFAQWSPEDVGDLIAEYPLAWIVSARQPECALQMPLLMEPGEGPTLLGHLPRRHPLLDVLATQPRVWCLFQGPQSYITPAWVDKPGWAPTWNFASLRIEADLAADENLTDLALQRLTEHMEQNSAAPWQVADMGERYFLLRQQVVGFRARIVSVRGRFKLGQDEEPGVLESIIGGLGSKPLAQWMRRFANRR